MRLKILLGLLLLFLLSPGILWLLWKYTPQKQMKIFVLDKTVLNNKTQEHTAFFWTLENQRITKYNDSIYNPTKDYFGMFPDNLGAYSIFDLELFSDDKISTMAYDYDMAYFTDLYGVYNNEWDVEYPFADSNKTTKSDLERSRLLYGGLTSKELLFLQKMKENKKLIINEFNTFATPTSAKIRKEYENEFHISWTGWVGRYFENLDTNVNKELPKWLISNYMKQNKNQWPFQKSGIAFVNLNDQIVILENKTHLTAEVPFITTNNAYSLIYNIIPKIKYPFWFDICSTDATNQVVSKYEIETNSIGDSILQAHKIPKSFPAVIKHTIDYTYYYFAGDFADVPISIHGSQIKYINYFDFLFYDNSVLERKSFFWKYYNPLITTIIENYYQKNKKQQ